MAAARLLLLLLLQQQLLLLLLLLLLLPRSDNRPLTMWSRAPTQGAERPFGRSAVAEQLPVAVRRQVSRVLQRASCWPRPAAFDLPRIDRSIDRL